MLAADRRELGGGNGSAKPQPLGKRAQKPCLIGILGTNSSILDERKKLLVLGR